MFPKNDHIDTIGIIVDQTAKVRKRNRTGPATGRQPTHTQQSAPERQEMALLLLECTAWRPTWLPSAGDCSPRATLRPPLPFDPLRRAAGACRARPARRPAGG